MGHGSKAVHRAHARKAEATVPTLEVWLKELEAKAHREAGVKTFKMEFNRGAAEKVQTS